MLCIVKEQQNPARDFLFIASVESMIRTPAEFNDKEHVQRVRIELRWSSGTSPNENYYIY